MSESILISALKGMELSNYTVHVASAWRGKEGSEEKKNTFVD